MTETVYLFTKKYSFYHNNIAVQTSCKKTNDTVFFYLCLIIWYRSILILTMMAIIKFPQLVFEHIVFTQNCVRLVTYTFDNNGHCILLIFTFLIFAYCFNIVALEIKWLNENGRIRKNRRQHFAYLGYLIQSLDTLLLIHYDFFRLSRN